MTIGYVSTAGSGDIIGPTATMSVSKPSSTVSGSLLFMVIREAVTNLGANSGTEWDLGAPTSSGWSTLISTQLPVEGGVNHVGRESILWKIAGASEPSSYTFTWPTPGPPGCRVAGRVFNYGTGALGVRSGMTQVSPQTAVTWPGQSIGFGGRQLWIHCTPVSHTTTEVASMTQSVSISGTGSNDAISIYEATVTPGSIATRTDAHTNYTSGSPIIKLQNLGLFITAASAPNAPTLQYPTGGVPVDATATTIFTSAYNSTDAQDCDAYILHIKTSAGIYMYWDATAGTLSTTPVWNTISAVADGGLIQVTIPGSILANGNTYNWSLNTQESASSLQGTFAADATFITQVGPTVTATAPTGTVTTTTSPPVTWTETLHSGSSQISYHAVWESGTYGSVPGSGTLEYDTGVVLSAALTATPTPLDNSKTYRVFVKITQTGPQDSAWSHIDFTISVTPPVTPLLAASPDTNATSGEPRVNLDVLGLDDGSGSFDYTNTVFQVQVSLDAGVTWVDVRGASAVTPDSTDKATVYAYSAPFGGEGAYFRVRTIGTPVNPIISDWSDIAVCPLTSPLFWVHDPLDPDSGMQVALATDDQRPSPISQDVTSTLGSTQPVVTSDVREMQRGMITWVTFTPAQRLALIALLNRGRTLLARFPDEQDQSGDLVYFLPVGPITTARYAQAALPGRTVATAWVGRDRP